MTTLFHGEDLSALHTKLAAIKNTVSKEVLTLEGKSLTDELLSQALKSNSLFEESKLVIIDNLSANKSQSESETVYQLEPSIDLILVEDKKLSASQITALQKKFGKMSVEEFKTNPAVFKFLDALMPGNQKQLFPLWQSYRQSEVPEIIVSMLSRQWRLMLLSLCPDRDSNSDWKRLADWQKPKITAQAVKFTQTRLLTLLNQLSELDFQSKTGRLNLPLLDSLELFLLKL